MRATINQGGPELGGNALHTAWSTIQHSWKLKYVLRKTCNQTCLQKALINFWMNLTAAAKKIIQHLHVRKLHVIWIQQTVMHFYVTLSNIWHRTFLLYIRHVFVDCSRRIPVTHSKEEHSPPPQVHSLPVTIWTFLNSKCCKQIQNICTSSYYHTEIHPFHK
jgi:hypothetical protein